MANDVNLLSLQAHKKSKPFIAVERSGVSANFRHATGWDDLVATVTNNHIELVLWSRGLHNIKCIDETVEASEFELLEGMKKDVLSKFKTMFEESKWPISLYETVHQDVYAFLSTFEKKVPNSYYRLRLQALSNDGCRKFHQDRTFQRLIITYRGPGTIWREAENTIEHEATVMECVLLRGKRKGRDSQILHKSPLFPKGQPPRLIMVIDAIPYQEAPS